MTRLYTTQDASDALGIGTRRVKQLCADLGFQRQGRDWLLTDADLDAIRARMAAPLKRGWPKGKPRKKVTP